MRFPIALVPALLFSAGQARAEPVRQASPSSAIGAAVASDTGPPPHDRDRLGPFGMSRSFKTWQAVCDWRGPCHVQPSESATPTLRRLSPAGPWSIEFHEHRPGRSAPVSMTVDGQTAPTFTGKFVGWAGGDGWGAIAPPPRLAPALIKRLREGRLIDRLSVGEDGEARGVSLDGLVAAMTWVEDRQPRLGALTPRRDLVVRQVAEVLEAEMAFDCGLALDAGWWAEPEQRRLPGGQRVVRAPCEWDESRQVLTSKFFLASNKGTLQPIDFVTVGSDNRWLLEAILDNGRFALTGEEITSEWMAPTHQGRCGGSGRWRWNGRRFAMTEARTARCDGGAVTWTVVREASSGQPEPRPD